MPNVDADSFKYDKEQLVTAATIIGAELQVSRNFSYTAIQPHIFKLVTMANAQVLGYWGGASARADQLRGNGC